MASDSLVESDHRSAFALDDHFFPERRLGSKSDGVAGTQFFFSRHSFIFWSLALMSIQRDYSGWGCCSMLCLRYDPRSWAKREPGGPQSSKPRLRSDDQAPGRGRGFPRPLNWRCLSWCALRMQINFLAELGRLANYLFAGPA